MSDAFKSNGATKKDQAKIKKLTGANWTPEQISRRLKIKLDVVKSFIAGPKKKGTAKKTVANTDAD